MENARTHQKLGSVRRTIAGEVRSLRQDRRWTQAALADRLGLSQSRLSEIERGDGSFTAEQFLEILKLFNIPPSRFGGTERNRDADLQNALARLGATELRERDNLLPSEELNEVHDVIREALVQGTPRFITSLAPVLVRNIDRLSAGRLQVSLLDAGLERRLGWLIENILNAIRRELSEPLPHRWALLCRRAAVVLGTLLDSLGSLKVRAAPPDVLDSTIRSQKTLEEIRASSSTISQHWGVVTQLQPEDFVQALRAARDHD